MNPYITIPKIRILEVLKEFLDSNNLQCSYISTGGRFEDGNDHLLLAGCSGPDGIQKSQTEQSRDFILGETFRISIHLEGSELHLGFSITVKTLRFCEDLRSSFSLEDPQCFDDLLANLQKLGAI